MATSTPKSPDTPTARRSSFSASAALAIALAALSVAIAVAPWCRAALAEHRAPTTKQEEAGAGVSVQSPATASPV